MPGTMREDELLIPVPCFDSDTDSEDDELAVERARVRKLQHLAALQKQYAEDYERLVTSGPEHHTHTTRSLHKDPGFYQDLTADESIADGCNIEYISVHDPQWTAERFSDEFVKGCKPVMLTGATDGWRAKERWDSAESFVAHYGDVPFKVTEVFAVHGLGKPRQVRLPLAKYVEYTQTNTADFPFYVFERELYDERAPLLEDFKVPAYFTDDLYDLTPAARNYFPKYRYMVIGGQRTGSNMHVDPKLTCAWNSLLSGHKRWVLFKPGDAAEYKRAIGVCEDECAPPAPPTYWWQDVYPQLVASGRAQQLGMIECIQRPGDTIFVPQGWWHAVLNLDFTVAVTQNALLPAMLPDAWPCLQSRRPEFAAYLARALRRIRPEVCASVPEVAQLAEETWAEADRDDDVFGDYS